MTVWLTADLHLGHRLVSRLRGFGDNTDAHDRAVADAWRALVRSDDDQVWVLGDVAVSDVDRALTLVASLPGVKHLVAGNHDACHPMHRAAHRAQPRYLTAFASVSTATRRRYNGRTVLLSHFPYAADREEYASARHPQWRLPDLGAALLHGHTHSPDRVTSAREVHVGLDAWGLAPVRLDEAVALLEPEPEPDPGDAPVQRELG